MIQRFGVIRIPKRFFESEEIPNISSITNQPFNIPHFCVQNVCSEINIAKVATRFHFINKNMRFLT